MREILRVAVLPLISSLVLAQAPAKLNLVVVEGEGAINNVKQRTVRPTIVEVQDENHKPIGGVAVTFLLPDSGPGGVFASGAKTATVVTDSAGRASMPGFQPNMAGQFQIRVTTSYQGQQASATIGQSNALRGGPGVGGSHAKLIAIIGGVAAAGGIAAAVALTRNGSSASTLSISGPGTANVGPPR